ncbi:unnamed protein product [Prunus brigantina]
MDEEQKLEFELQRILDMVGNNDLSGMTEFSNPSNSQDIMQGTEASIDKNDKMLSLTNKNFQSREDLIEAAHKIAFMQGYALVIRRSKSEIYVVLGCDRGGNYKSRKVPLEERKKKSASRLINCPFEIWGKKKRNFKDFGSWRLKVCCIIMNLQRTCLDIPIVADFQMRKLCGLKKCVWLVYHRAKFSLHFDKAILIFEQFP